MSIFSQLLQEHFQEKKVKIYQIAQLSNIERTLLQKILTGSRKPSSEEQVTRLAQALMLTASETKELKNAYQILHMGEENWSRRSAVRKLVQSFHINDSPLRWDSPPTSPSPSRGDQRNLWCHQRQTVRCILSCFRNPATRRGKFPLFRSQIFPS